MSKSDCVPCAPGQDASFEEFNEKLDIQSGQTRCIHERKLLPAKSETATRRWFARC